MTFSVFSMMILLVVRSLVFERFVTCEIWVSAKPVLVREFVVTTVLLSRLSLLPVTWERL